MNEIIKKIPLPFCGVILSLASLGTLLEPHLPWALPVFGVVAALLLALMIARAVLFPNAIATELENPVVAAVAETFPMTLFAFTPYVARVQWHLAFALWIAALVIYLVIAIRHFMRFAIKTPLSQITPGYFVTYIPILMAANTAPLFAAESFGRGLFWIVLLIWIGLFVAVTLRLVRFEPLDQPLLPLLCIYAAPMSMCLTAYLSCFSSPSVVFASIMYLVSFVLFLAGAGVFLLCLKLPFFPTYAAMTFPFVISATASALFATLLEGSLFGGVVNVIATLQALFAIVAVGYVLVRYFAFLIQGVRQ